MTEIQHREHLADLQRADRKGTRKASLDAHRFPKRAKPSPRYQPQLTDLVLAEAANLAANQVLEPIINPESIPDPEPVQKPDHLAPGPVFVDQEGVVQPKVEKWDC